MKNQSDTILCEILNASRQVVQLLKQQAPIESILELMQERDKWVEAMSAVEGEHAPSSSITELMQFQKEESELLQPYANEMQAIRVSLVKLKQIGQYLVSDPSGQG